jgi:phosphatidylinositol dimannoside acyltransferase
MPTLAEPGRPAPRRAWREVWRDRLVRGIYHVGWRTASRLPARVESMIISTASRGAVHHNGSHLQTLRRNLTVLTGHPADDDLLRRAIASYLRNIGEALSLHQWSGAEIRSRVTTVNESVLRTAYTGAGAVVALPHSGNWDLAGAWACLTGMPVTTVAEQLADDEYADFVAFRQGLGMEVLSHRDPNAISELVFAVRRRRLVCLIADRDLEQTGVPVRWAGQEITMPAGPAMIARRSGAALIPAVCQFTPAGMKIIFGDRIAPEPGRTGLRAMTQQVADFFAATLSDRPEDWHMMQPFFAEPDAE